jgi:N-acetyl-anhydromuramyl-L-alanine amidase AmpD
MRTYAESDLELLKANMPVAIDAQVRRFEDTTADVQEPERPDPETVPGDVQITTLDKPLLSFPSLQMKTQGTFANGFPKGLVVHFTAGRDEKGLQSAKDTVAWGIQMGYAFWCMGTDGQIIRTHDVSRWGYHCGSSSWPTLGSSLSNQLLGLEICNPGLLKKSGEKYLTWFGAEVPAHMVVEIKDRRYPQETPGFYAKYTPEQESALVDLILYLKASRPDVFQIAYVLGHDEVSPGRKNDPGGALSMGMPELRKRCAQIWLDSQKGIAT